MSLLAFGVMLLGPAVTAGSVESKAALALKLIAYDRRATGKSGDLSVVVVGGPGELPQTVQTRSVQATPCPAEPDAFAACATAASPEVVLTAPAPGLVTRLKPRLPDSVRYLIGLDEVAVAEGAMWAIDAGGQVLFNQDALARRGVELDPSLLRRGRRVGGAPNGPIELPEGATPPLGLDGNPVPEYPPEARESDREGDVELRVTVTVEGTVRDARVVSGEAPFTDAALAAVKRWRYQPARVDGRPVAVYRTLKFPFRLR